MGVRVYVGYHAFIRSVPYNQEIHAFFGSQRPMPRPRRDPIDQGDVKAPTLQISAIHAHERLNNAVLIRTIPVFWIK